MLDHSTAKELVSAIAGGRACLLLGQDHTEGLVETAIQEASALANRPLTTLTDALSNVGVSTVAASIAAYVSLRQIPLLELASLPWSSVVSTAVDSGFPDALVAAGSTRRLIEAPAERITLTSGAHSPAALHVFHVLGRGGGSGDLIPPDAQTLSGKLLLKLPRALDGLPQLLGTRGVLVIEGMADGAWLNDVSWEILCEALRKIPAGRVYWFGWAPANLRQALAGVVAFVEERLTKLLAAWASDDELSTDLATGRKAVFGIDDHAVTIGAGKTRKTVYFSAKDWREILRVGSALDDAQLDRMSILDSDPLEGGLAGFVRRAHVGVPEWVAAARGYCFRRDATDELVEVVVSYLCSPKQSLLDHSGGGAMRRPLLLAGPPAIGKSVGLLRAAWELRKTHGAFVLWLLPGLSGINAVQLERVIRTVESRGVPWTVLVVDGLPPDECARILAKMLSDGRSVVLLGTETAPFDDNESAHGHTRFPIDITLSPEESSDWSAFLAKHGLADPSTGGRDFLTRLNRVLPEVGYGSTSPLLEEYERVIRGAEPSGTQLRASESLLAQKLRALLPDFVRETDGEPQGGRFEGDPFVRDLVEMILFCAASDLPVATDTLFVLLGSDLLNAYDRIQHTFGQTALIQEVTLDNEGTIGLTTAHRLHAQWLLRALRSTPSSRLDVLQSIVGRVPWDLDAYPGDNPTQDYVLRLLRQVGPRGAAAEDFGSLPALRKLADILSTVWRTHGRRHPGLLSLEAIIRGDIARRDADASSEEKRRQCLQALQLLDAAIELLRARRPSEARSFELQRALTLAADVRGTELNIILRDATPALDEVRESLSKLESDVMMARSYDTKYHPLDVLFWANRDVRNLLVGAEGDSSDFEIDLLSTMQMALDVAGDEQIIDDAQRTRRDERRIELDSLLGQAPLARERAEEMRERGNLAGELVLSRIAIDAAQHHPIMCRDELERLLSFGPTILSDVRALRYLCRLWLDAWVGPKFGAGAPVFCSAPSSAWEQLQNITRARLAVPEDSEHPLTTFQLGWAQLQLGDADGARDSFSRLERRSIGMRRRVGELAVVSDEHGRARHYMVRVQARRGDSVVVRVDALGMVIEMRPEVEAGVAPSGLEIGELLEVAIAMNYRGLSVRNLNEGPRS